MSNKKSLHELIHEAKARISEDFRSRTMEREGRLADALAEYLADKWEAEFGLIQSDALAQLVTEAEAGVLIDLRQEFQDLQARVNNWSHSFAHIAIRKLKKRDFAVKEDPERDDPRHELPYRYRISRKES
ncbi:hypothetical protein HYT45_03970 [Candidatus Uhrbacteria bacterium]|nr:hypothetical protein [Candidatus Uhrbacteria bacterium]